MCIKGGGVVDYLPLEPFMPPPGWRELPKAMPAKARAVLNKGGETRGREEERSGKEEKGEEEVGLAEEKGERNSEEE